MSLSDKIAIIALIVSTSGFTIKGTIIYFRTARGKLKAIIKNPYIRSFFLIIILSCLVAFIPWGKIHYGDNLPAEKITIKHDTIVKILKVESPLIISSKSSNLVKPKRSQIVEKVSEPRRSKDTSKYTSKYNITAPVSNSAIGDNATTNNYGIQPRKIPDSDIDIICNSFPDKSINIYFTFYGFGDAEMNAVINQIANSLRLRGYINIDKAPHIALGEVPPEKIILKHSKDGKYLEIAIPPAQ